MGSNTMAAEQSVRGEVPSDETPRWLFEGLRGNETPFVERYYPQILAWATMLVQKFSLAGAVDPEDITQDVVRRFLEKPEWTYVPQVKARFRDYLREAVRNRVLDELKKRTRRPGDFGVGRDDDDLLSNLEASIDEFSQRFDTQWKKDQVYLREASERVRARVGPHRWLAFFQTVVEKKKGVEVAQALGMTPSAVYSARGDVARLLRDELHELGFHPQSHPNEPPRP